MTRRRVGGKVDSYGREFSYLGNSFVNVISVRLQLHLFSSSSLSIFLLLPPSFSLLLLALNEIGVVLRRGQRTLRGRHPL